MKMKCFRLTEIVRILQYPRYLFHINELYDDRGSSIIENILCHGQIDQLKIVHDQLTVEGALTGSPNEVEEYSRQINDVFKHLGTVQSFRFFFKIKFFVECKRTGKSGNKFRKKRTESY